MSTKVKVGLGAWAVVFVVAFMALVWSPQEASAFRGCSNLLCLSVCPGVCVCEGATPHTYGWCENVAVE